MNDGLDLIDDTYQGDDMSVRAVVDFMDQLGFRFHYFDFLRMDNNINKSRFGGIELTPENYKKYGELDIYIYKFYDRIMKDGGYIPGFIIDYISPNRVTYITKIFKYYYDYLHSDETILKRYDNPEYYDFISLVLDIINSYLSGETGTEIANKYNLEGFNMIDIESTAFHTSLHPMNENPKTYWTKKLLKKAILNTGLTIEDSQRITGYEDWKLFYKKYLPFPKDYYRYLYEKIILKRKIPTSRSVSPRRSVSPKDKNKRKRSMSPEREYKRGKMEMEEEEEEKYISKDKRRRSVSPNFEKMFKKMRL